MSARNLALKAVFALLIIATPLLPQMAQSPLTLSLAERMKLRSVGECTQQTQKKAKSASLLCVSGVDAAANVLHFGSIQASRPRPTSRPDFSPRAFSLLFPRFW